jgi:hypothetical protein
MEDYSQYRSRLNPVLALLPVPDPEDIYRWRVQYDCSCIDEQLATNDTVEWLLAHSQAYHTPDADLSPSQYFELDLVCGSVATTQRGLSGPLLRSG